MNGLSERVAGPKSSELRGGSGVNNQSGRGPLAESVKKSSQTSKTPANREGLAILLRSGKPELERTTPALSCGRELHKPHSTVQLSPWWDLLNLSRCTTAPVLFGEGRRDDAVTLGLDALESRSRRHTDSLTQRVVGLLPHKGAVRLGSAVFPFPPGSRELA